MSSSVIVVVAGVPLAFAEKTFSSLFDCDHTTVASSKRTDQHWLYIVGPIHSVS